MARLPTIAIIAAALVALAGCGASGGSGASDGSGGSGGEASPATASEEARGPTAESAGRRELVANRGATRRAAAQRQRARRGRPLRTVDSQFGRVVADRRGEALYLFDKEKGRRSQCYGDCARAWPPVLTRARPRALRGVDRELLGVTRRRNGSFQVTYRNRPLYYYVEDRPGLILCQNVFEYGGLWLLVRPNGTPVT